MFDQHQPKIAAYAQSSAEGMARTIQFAMGSARRPLFTWATEFRELCEGDDRQSPLTPMRREAWALLWLSREAIYHHTLDIASRDDCENHLIGYLATLPGLGLAKAGFVCQLSFGISGCLDSHNLTRYNISENTFKGYKERRTRLGRLKLAARYNDTIEKHGGTRALWNNWCALVAKRHPQNYSNANDVSALHCAALNLT
jgi:hypothetical protein